MIPESICYRPLNVPNSWWWGVAPPPVEQLQACFKKEKVRKLAHIRKEYLAFLLAAKASSKFQLSSLRKACRTENQRRLVLNNLRLLSARFELGIV